MKIAIVTSGVAPVPATKGGAVENLIEHIIKENEVQNKIKIDVYSIYDYEAKKISLNYKSTSFKYFKSGKFSTYGDNIIYYIMKNVLKKDNNMKYRNIIKRFEYIFKIKNHLFKEDYDKIILENHGTLFWAIKGKNFKKYKDKYYIHLHNELNSIWQCKKIAKNCRKIIGVSKFICKSACDRLENYSIENTEVLYNCIDVNRFNKEKYIKDIHKLRSKYEIKDDDIVAIFSGRLISDKGILEVLKAFEKINNDKIKLLIVGSFFYNSDMSSSYSENINKISNKIKEKVIFTGYVDYSDIPKIYSIADFAVLPSIWEEPAGLTVIESMAMGLPVITTNSGGIPEYVNNESAIILEKNKDLIGNLVKEIERLAYNSDLRVYMGKKGRENSLKYNTCDYYIRFNEIIGD